MEPRRWVRHQVEDATVAKLAEHPAIDQRTARLLAARGVRELEEVEAFLKPRLADLPDPSLIKDLDRAATRIADAIDKQEKVALYGDYDVDGVTSSALLAAFLQSEGLTPRVYIPKRLREGYGLNPEAVDVLAAEGTQLLITLDCGITATREIARASTHGIESIVVDHHRCPPELPEAFATLNCQQDDCTYPDKGLAAVGVCFNLVCGLRRELRARGRYEGREEPNLRRYLDLCALGTIADMVPLSGVNRVLAWYGVQELRAARRPGVRALLEVSRVRPLRVTSTDVSFRLGPRINAAGRLSDASIGVQLMLAEDMATARPLAATLNAANGQRQQIEATVYEGAVAQIEADRAEAGGALPEAFVLHGDDWHPGVVGIVASKIVEKYERPTIIIGQGGRGSARTARGVHLYNAINDVSHHLMKFGGHRAAAGMTIEPSKIPEFRRDLVARVAQDPDKGEAVATLFYDEEINAGEFDAALADQIEQLQPFGNGNPQPLFKTSGAEVRSARIVGHDHLKLRLRKVAKGGIEGIAFKRGEFLKEISPGSTVDLAYHVEKNEFSGMEYLELRIRDLKTPDVTP